MAHQVEAMFSAGRIVPWHGLGLVIEEAPNSKEAIKLAGLDWGVRKQQLHVGDKVAQGYYATIREDNKDILGVVKGRYEIVQNHDAFAFTDALLKGGEVKYETAGSLKGGKQIWMTAKMNRDYDILGDKFDPYIVFANSHDGSGAVKVMMTPIRVVCANTLNLAMQQASRSWSSKHVGDMTLKMHEAERTLGLASEYMDALNEEANSLFDIRMTSSRITELLHELFPVDSKMTNRKASNQRKKKEGILEAMKADDLKKFNGTGWQFVNALTDYTQHAEPGRRTAEYKENKFSNVVNGDKELDAAHNLLLQLA